jgi:hypothetical protein
VQIGLASINVRRDERLIPSTLDGKDYHCAVTNVYRDLIGFSNNKVCFGETNGKFTVLRYAPGSYCFTLDLLPPLETIKTEVITSINGGYTKKELVYNGSNKNTLTFIEREYTSNLETPSKTKPIAIVVDATPKVVEVSGALINVIEYNNNSLTLTLEKPFD